ncbi:MAG: cytochrome c maturation protein CcmE [Saprospiraceae bacterium]|nr:cytochrome c maturation protein CcmE [Saprospiraceae bacterium]
MKPIHIVALLVLAGGVAALTMQAKDISTYATFKDATTASNKVKVAGKLIKDKPMVYDPVVNPNLFTFYLKDTNGKEVLVNLLKPKPQDFELSEQVVVTGDMQGEAFVANEVLMKCPSKYKDEEIYMKKKKE